MAEHVAPGAPVEARGLYVRQSSGLIREFRPADVFVFNTLGYALGLVLAVVPTFMAGLWPEQNVLLVVGIGTVLTLANAAMYGYLAGTMRSGATTSTSRACPPLHRLHGELGLHVVAVPRARPLLGLRRQLRDRDRIRHAGERDRERHARGLERRRERRLAGVPDRHGHPPARPARALPQHAGDPQHLHDRVHPGPPGHVRDARRPLHDVEGGVRRQVRRLHGGAGRRADVPGADRPGLERRLLGR